MKTMKATPIPPIQSPILDPMLPNFIDYPQLSGTASDLREGLRSLPARAQKIDKSLQSCIKKMQRNVKIAVATLRIQDILY